MANSTTEGTIRDIEWCKVSPKSSFDLFDFFYWIKYFSLKVWRKQTIWTFWICLSVLVCNWKFAFKLVLYGHKLHWYIPCSTEISPSAGRLRSFSVISQFLEKSTCRIYKWQKCLFWAYLFSFFLVEYT